MCVCVYVRMYLGRCTLVYRLEFRREDLLGHLHFHPGQLLLWGAIACPVCFVEIVGAVFPLEVVEDVGAACFFLCWCVCVCVYMIGCVILLCAC